MPRTEIDPDELRARLRAGDSLYFLDVREPAEVAEWAFPGAVNIPMSQLGARTDELPTDRPIVVGCHSGVRSPAVVDALERGGWTAVNLTGGAVAGRPCATRKRGPPEPACRRHKDGARLV
jgi:rhodanese-related sulfurtransferase